MATTLFGIGGTTPLSGASHVTPTAAGTASAHAAEKDRRYDQVTLSAAQEGTDRFRMTLCGRLSQEVRAVTTTGELQELGRQVHSREYRPDASEIAARMLLLKGDE